MTDETPRRFIAGALCPQCGEIDKLVMYRRRTTSFRECVQCGFAEQTRFDTGGAMPETRVSREPEQALRFVETGGRPNDLAKERAQ